MCTDDIICSDRSMNKYYKIFFALLGREILLDVSVSKTVQTIDDHP